MFWRTPTFRGAWTWKGKFVGLTFITISNGKTNMLWSNQVTHFLSVCYPGLDLIEDHLPSKCADGYLWLWHLTRCSFISASNCFSSMLDYQWKLFEAVLCESSYTTLCFRGKKKNGRKEKFCIFVFKKLFFRNIYIYQKVKFSIC